MIRVKYNMDWWPSYGLLFIPLLLTIAGCKPGVVDEGEKYANLCEIKHLPQQDLNISFLLDLSDRIDTNKYPNQTMQYYKRDIAYINDIAEIFECHLLNKKTILINDEIKVFINPEPGSKDVNSIIEALKIKFTKQNASIPSIQATSDEYVQGCQQLYSQALKDANYIGSDIWNFMKVKVEDFCIQKKKRNILVIITDGYMYHLNSKYSNEGQLSYITNSVIAHQGLNSPNWKDIIKEKNYGFMPCNSGLGTLDVLVLGVNPNRNNNPYEFDVLEYVWTKWLSEMGVNKAAFYEAELPSNLQRPIQKFILGIE